MPTPPLPLRPPGSFASADDISKEPLQLYEGRRGGFNLDKSGPRCGPKGQPPIHVKVGECVHACVKKGGGIAWTHQRGSYESSRVSEAEKHEAPHTSNTPSSHLYSHGLWASWTLTCSTCSTCRACGACGACSRN